MEIERIVATVAEKDRSAVQLTSESQGGALSSSPSALSRYIENRGPELSWKWDSESTPA
jgi:hypothetical protein